MHDKGVMKWANGDLYDGFWFNGLRHGSGIYRFSDGGYYFGTWTRGLKDGKGTFYPAGSRHSTVKKWHATLDFDDTGKGMLRPSLSSGEFKVNSAGVRRSLSEKISFSGSFRSSCRISHRTILSDAKYTHGLSLMLLRKEIRQGEKRVKHYWDGGDSSSHTIQLSPN